MKYEKATAKVTVFENVEFMAGSQDYFATTQYWGLLKCYTVFDLQNDFKFRCESVLARNIMFPDKPGAPEVQSWLNFECRTYSITG